MKESFVKFFDFELGEIKDYEHKKNDYRYNLNIIKTCQNFNILNIIHLNQLL